MRPLFRLVMISILLWPLAAATLGCGAAPMGKADATERLNAILARIRDEVTKANDVTELLGIDCSKSEAAPAEVTSVTVAPYYLDSVGDDYEDVTSSFSDHDMACLAPLKEITRLAIRRSTITDDGLRNLAGLDHLEHLDLAENAITDDGLQHLAGLTALRSLNLSKTHITGSGLAHLAKLRELRVLNLADTPVDGAGIANLPDLPLLEEFHAARTRIDGAGMAAFRRTPNLRKLDLDETLADDAGLAHLRGLTELRVLLLRTRHVQGAGLVHLGDLTQLQGLDCRPIWSKDLAAVLSRWKKLSSLDIQAPDPTTLPRDERTIELYGMESLFWLRLHCPHGAEAIDLRDMPKLRDVSVEPSVRTRGGDDKPIPRIGQIRISSVKSLSHLCIPIPERLVLPDLTTIDWLQLDGSLRTEPLSSALRKLKLRELSLKASADSQPSALSAFAGTFCSNRKGRAELWLEVDVFNASWLEELRKLSPSPEEIGIVTRTFDNKSVLQLASLNGLKQFQMTARVPVTVPRLVLDGPKSLRSLTLEGIQAEELHFKGWFPDSLTLPSARRVIVSDLAEEKSIPLPLGHGEFELHNAPQLTEITCPPMKGSDPRKLVVHDARKLQRLVATCGKLTSIQLLGEFPELRHVEMNGSAMDDAFLTRLKGIASLKVVEVRGNSNLSDGAVVSFCETRPDVSLRFRDW